MAHLPATTFEQADHYAVESRIASKLTRRCGTVKPWPPLATPIIGAVWVHWDDGIECFAWRHQINRL